MNLVRPPQRDTMLLYWASSLAAMIGNVAHHIQEVYSTPEFGLMRVQDDVAILKRFVDFLEEAIQGRIDEPKENEPHRSAK